MDFFISALFQRANSETNVHTSILSANSDYHARNLDAYFHTPPNSASIIRIAQNRVARIYIHQRIQLYQLIPRGLNLPGAKGTVFNYYNLRLFIVHGEKN